MIRRAFFAFSALCVIGLTGVAAAKLVPEIGPRVEWWVSPITGPQRIDPQSVAMIDGGRLCWTRWTTKLRDAEPWNFDVFLDRPWSGDRTFPEVTDRDDGHSWHTKGALKAGEARDQHQCIRTPADLAPNEPLVLSQTIHFPGFHGWWDLPVALPTVNFTMPGETPHDTAPTPSP